MRTKRKIKENTCNTNIMECKSLLGKRKAMKRGSIEASCIGRKNDTEGGGGKEGDGEGGGGGGGQEEME